MISMEYWGGGKNPFFSRLTGLSLGIFLSFVLKVKRSVVANIWIFFVLEIKSCVFRKISILCCQGQKVCLWEYLSSFVLEVKRSACWKIFIQSCQGKRSVSGKISILLFLRLKGLSLGIFKKFCS